MAENPLKQTALNAAHRRLGGKMVSYGGWDMPVTYAGTIDEHMAVRTAAGLFDVSHMGEVEVHGPQALQLVQHLTTNDASKLHIGQAHYSGLLYPNGGFVDDLLVHKLSDEHYLLCINASNTDKDFAWIRQHATGFDAEAVNTSPNYTQLALQGPQALTMLQPLVDVELSTIKYYWFTHGKVAGVPALIARTGYTGEDGFELYFDPNKSERVWNKLLEAGQSYGIQPCGLAARNTLRLEAKMALYGNDIDDTTTPLEADLAWIVKLQKGDFIGRDVLVKQKEAGLTRKLIGFEMLDRGIAREHYPIWIGDAQVSQVSSGSPAPFLKKNIGLAYLPLEHTAVGTRFDVEIRGKRTTAQVVETPFYKRAK
ncbi:MAG: glycine cleavage system aminomethyltransferase GcvT [Acidobacteria bacterium]|nr:glycine cleavage system aminomethyltransferase GcvT [Acidobacteriota bacterium]MBI3425858.1 glycine cleavage system aminomethyltransferase GcvT [Acidobacteriota bacterium]